METIKIVGIVLLILLLLAIGPFLTIWALNTLFPALAIGYTLETWAAVILLSMALRSTVNVNKKD